MSPNDSRLSRSVVLDERPLANPRKGLSLRRFVTPRRLLRPAGAGGRGSVPGGRPRLSGAPPCAGSRAPQASMRQCADAPPVGHRDPADPRTVEARRGAGGTRSARRRRLQPGACRALQLNGRAGRVLIWEPKSLGHEGEDRPCAPPRSDVSASPRIGNPGRPPGCPRRNSRHCSSTNSSNPYDVATQLGTRYRDSSGGRGYPRLSANSSGRMSYLPQCSRRSRMSPALAASRHLASRPLEGSIPVGHCLRKRSRGPRRRTTIVPVVDVNPGFGVRRIPITGVLLGR